MTRFPCGHAAVSRGCGGCDPGAVDLVLDDTGRVVWRAPQDAMLAEATAMDLPRPPRGVHVLDAAGRVVWREEYGHDRPEAPRSAQGRSGHPPCIVDPHDDGSHVDADYQPTTMHRAVCADCKPVLPRAFDTTDDRDLWVFEHIEHTEHRVFLAPDPTPTSTADEALAAVERAHEALAALVASLHDPDHPSKETP